MLIEFCVLFNLIKTYFLCVDIYFKGLWMFLPGKPGRYLVDQSNRHKDTSSWCFIFCGDWKALNWLNCASWRGCMFYFYSYFYRWSCWWEARGNVELLQRETYLPEISFLKVTFLRRDFNWMFHRFFVSHLWVNWIKR